MNNYFLKQSIHLNNQITLKNKNGFFSLEKDLEAVELYERHVKENWMSDLTGFERLKWLIESDYYISNLVDGFTDDQIKEIIQITYAQNFKFTSYMAISKFYEAYALKTDDGQHFLENYQDRVIAVSIFLSKKNFNVAKKLAYYMANQIYQPATPTFANAAKKKSGELVSCFLLEVDDTINSINYIISTSMQLSKIGGGVAINLSKLRSKGASIKNISSAASGVIPILKILENVFDYADQLGSRPGSGVAYLSIFHYDLIDFIDCKKINADEKSRIQTLSIALLVYDKFFQLAKENQDFFIFEPLSIYKKYGMHMADMDMNDWYDKLAADNDVVKKPISSRFMLNKIAQCQFESGYPYIVFLDNANRQNPLKGVGRITMSNLCTEIYQVQTTSIINDYDKEDEIGYDVSCTLGSLNLVNLFENKNFEEVIYSGMVALSNVTDISSIANAPGIRKANESYKSVGLGVMNFAGLLIKNKIPYDSDIAIEVADVLFAAINYYSILASAKIAKVRNQKFENFEKSDYATGEYFEKYLKNDFFPTSEKVISMFEEIKLPTRDDWKKLSEFVKEYGLYNAYRLAIAPTQSISYLHGSTASTQPIIDLIETRMYEKSLTYFPMPFLNIENQFYYKSSYLLNQMKLIDISATIQKHVDQGISTILFATNNTTTRDLARLYIYANQKGLKALYYTRTKNLEVTECIACSA